MSSSSSSEEQQPSETAEVFTSATLTLPWKKVNTGDPGSTYSVGGNDWDRIAGLLGGDFNVGVVDFNSPVKFRSGKFVLRSPDDAFDLTFDNPNLLADRHVTFPNNMSADDEFVMSAADQTLINKTLDASRNTTVGVQLLPSAKKTGSIMCHSPTELGNGILDGHTKLGPDPIFNVQEFGSFLSWSTGITAGTEVGIRTPFSIVRGDFSPLLRVRFRVSNLGADQRLYIGMTSAPSLPIGNSPVSTTDSAFMFGFTDSDLNWQVFSADGQGILVRKIDTEIPKDTLFHTITLRYRYSGTSTILWRLDNLPEQGYDSNIPDPTIPMAFHITSQNASAANVSLDIAYVEAESYR